MTKKRPCSANDSDMGIRGDADGLWLMCDCGWEGYVGTAKLVDDVRYYASQHLDNEESS